MSTRSYRQMCPVARALDVVGERWTLLVVRELLLGPKRFKELMAHLPAMGTNRLSDRLKALTVHGVVTRRTLPPPADVAVYELTPFGEGLRPIVAGLASWGSRLAPDERVEPSSARAELIALMLAGRSPRQASAGLHESYEFQVGGEHFHVAVDDGAVTARSGASPREPALRASCDVYTFAQLAEGQLSPSHALRSGRVRIAGKPAALTRAFRVLTAPDAALGEDSNPRRVH
jgi:DNA-binding HxlR family transcriptional regulator